MTDGAAGVAVVRGVVHFRIVERRLKNSGGKVDVVHLRIEVGVNSGGRDVPLAMIDGLANLIDIAAGFELVSALDIARKIITNDIHGTVIAPLIRIANFRSEERRV